MSHSRFHRRQRDALPDPWAFAEAAAEAIAEANPFAEPEPEAEPQTFVQVVYVTASKTFDGPVGGYTTMGVVLNPDATPAPTSKPTPTPTPTPEESSSAPPSTTLQKSKTSSIPSVIIPDSSSTIAPTIPLLAATSSTALFTPSTSSASAASATTSNTSKAESSDGGMSTIGKVGLVVGILLLLGTVLAIALFMFKKRQAAAKKEQSANEKENPFADVQRATSTRSTMNAPRLSLRPVTQFLPMYGQKNQGQNNALPMTPTQTPPPIEKQSPWERQMSGNESNRNNPFGNHAEAIDSANAHGPPVVNEVGPGGEIVSGNSATAVGAMSLARGASKRGVKPLDFTQQPVHRMGLPSPAGTEFSESFEIPGTPNTPALTAGGAAIAAAGGPANSAVHRVQLDFKPSMDDELELRAGQLIRLLHEYDDGWALCIRLDRSRQGVVPRTCLSVRPVKPRSPPQGSPRGPPPPGMRLPNQGPPQNRRMSPPLAIRPQPGMTGSSSAPALNQSPRPQSPGMSQSPSLPEMGGARSMSPAPRPMPPAGAPFQGRDRSESSASQQSNTERAGPPPAAVGAVHRKPVGQAL